AQTDSTRYHEPVVVTTYSAAQTHIIRLVPYCTVLADVVDAATGRPIADQGLIVSVERGENVAGRDAVQPGRRAGPRGGPVPGRDAVWERTDGAPIPTPHTDAQGRATIWTPPGRGRIRVRPIGPNDYEEYTTAEPITLMAGQEVELRF